MRDFYQKTARPDGSFQPGIDPAYRGMSDAAYSDLAAVTSELLQSPILYITGHRSPKNRFTAIEKKLLKRYVDNGGFIVAEACCSNPEFDRGFRDLVEEVWPDAQLAELPAEHSIWTSPTSVSPASIYLRRSHRPGP